MTVVALVVLAVGTYVLKAVGPLVASGRELPPLLGRLATLLPAAMLAALVVNQTVVTDTGPSVDARLLGVAAAGIAVWLRAPFVVVVVVGAAVAAASRALGWG